MYFSEAFLSELISSMSLSMIWYAKRRPVVGGWRVVIYRSAGRPQKQQQQHMSWLQKTFIWVLAWRLHGTSRPPPVRINIQGVSNWES
jgi:hypothetical protein